MNAIVHELDEKLRTLDTARATALEQVVRHAIELAGNGKTAPPSSWPPGFFDRIRQEWGDEPFERPPQGEFEVREEW